MKMFILSSLSAIGIVIIAHIVASTSWTSSLLDPGLAELAEHGTSGLRSLQALDTNLVPSLAILPDLHGDLQNTLASLKLLGLVDAQGHWGGGQCVLVQLGDVIDRGDYSLATLDLLAQLQVEARAAGGDVVLLLGNHEAMNLAGDLRYVSRNEIMRLGKKVVTGDDTKPELQLWREQFAPGGHYWKMLAASAVAYIGGTGNCKSLFVHAGALPSLVTLARDEGHSNIVGAWNKAVRDHLFACADGDDGDASALGIPGLGKCDRRLTRLAERLLGGDGVLWTRAYSSMRRERVCAAVRAVTRALEVERIVVGHTVQAGGRPHPRCGGRLVMADIGLSSAIVGAVGGLMCSGDELIEVNAHQRFKLLIDDTHVGS